jgi:hypothetical protein
MSSQVFDEKVKIGGWLIIVAILLWSGAVSTGLSTINTTVLALGTHLTKYYIDCMIQILAFGSIITLLVKFHQRKASFVKWVFIYEAIIFIEECFHMYLNLAFHTEGQLGRIAVVVGVFIIALLEMFLVLLYVVRSKRVKRTFIR